jgi:anti-sigma regulatory factor (Ser/Thr protein kinase)
MTPLALRLPADGYASRRVRAELKLWLAVRDWPAEDVDDLLLAVSEAVENSAEHAYAEGAGAPAAEPIIAVRVTELAVADGRRVEVVVDDYGVWRSGSANAKFRGRGIAMMRKLMASCEMDHDRPGTRVTMISKLVPGHRESGATEGPVRLAPEERLRWLEAVTDTGLARLSVDRLLDELLDKVRELLVVDTAAVLLLDPSHQFLVATVARGIEEEVHQGVRIPLGHGFAGRIAGGQRPVAISQVDHDNVLNPILREKGIVSLLGVPLIAGGTVIGVLHVGSLSPREFSEFDAELLQMVGDRAALATQSRMSDAERAAVSVMQRNLLPAKLPDVPGWEFASRYVTGGEGDVGGDWYDVFTLPSGTICLLVGDSVGHGLAAAQSMSQMRAVLRSNALRAETPAELLTGLDEHVKHFQPGTIATVLCGMIRPSGNVLQMSSAGHPPPILARPCEEPITVAITPDLPLGVELGHPRHTTDVSLPPGAVLCLYSDGLVERRQVPLDDNIEILRTTVLPQPAESVCIDVMRRLIGPSTPEDDVAVLVVRRLPASRDEPAPGVAPDRAKERVTTVERKQHLRRR